MSFRCLCYAIIFATCTLPVCAGTCDRVIITADPAYPPLHWYDGQSFHGASITITRRVFDDLGIPYEIRYLGPWARVMDAAKLGKIDVVTTLKDTPERRAFLTFAMPPAFLNPIAIFVRKNEEFPYAQWRDLIGRHGGISRGNVFGGGFDEFMKANLSVELANNNVANFRKLDAGRIDYLLTGYYVGLSYFSEPNMVGRFKAIRPFIVETANQVGFVTKSPCMVHLAAFEHRLGELVKEKVPEQMLDQALKEWQNAPVMGN